MTWRYDYNHLKKETNATVHFHQEEAPEGTKDNSLKIGDKVRVIVKEDSQYNETGEIISNNGGVFCLRFNDVKKDGFTSGSLEKIKESTKDESDEFKVGDKVKLIDKELGLKLPGESEIEKHHYDCQLCPLTDHVRAKKRGFSRYEHNYAAMVRNRCMDRVVFRPAPRR